VLCVGSAATQVHFLTTEDAIDEYGLQPRSPGTASSDFNRQHSPQNSPRRAGPGGGAHPAVARDVARRSSTPATFEAATMAHQSGQLDLVHGATSVDTRTVGDRTFALTGVESLQPPVATSHDVETASPNGGCCGGRAREPLAPSHWMPSPDPSIRAMHAADGRPIAHVGPSVGREAGASKAHLP
jgi:hypothetical protein